MPFYQKHVFFCVNQRDNARQCCQDANAQAICDYAKQQLRELGLAGKGKIRISRSGCMGRCISGPCIVIYPEGVWYTYTCRKDIDDIIKQHLCQGKLVDRLLLAAD